MMASFAVPLICNIAIRRASTADQVRICDRADCCSALVRVSDHAGRVIGAI